jgi:predicted adenylyl cyclase CyaB
MAHYEIEVKTLLGEKANADALKSRMRELDPESACVSTNKQLNHYFTGGDVGKLYEKTEHLLHDAMKEKFHLIVEKGTNFSVRTRQKDDEVLLVVKASVDAGTSENTVSRLEFEEAVPVTLDELDALVLEAGFSYQAKWSREREEYAYKGANVCIDKNAGYGYLAEFEKIVHDDSDLSGVRKEIDALMGELEVVELSQDRLERMFKFYNENWGEYYGTEKTFIIE